MPRRIFRDFDAFAESIAGVAGRFVPTARSESDWWIDIAPVGAVSLQQLQIGAPSTFAGEGTPATLTLGIPMTDARLMRIDGHSLQAESLIYLTEDTPFTFAGHQACRWAGVTVPIEGPFISEAAVEAINRADSPRAETSIECLNSLRQLVAQVCSHDPQEPLGRPAITAIEQDIMSLVGRSVSMSTRYAERHIGRPQFSRNRVIAKSLALIEANEGQPLFIQDLCRAAEVSERTLRNIFQEYFGVGPMRLLKVRQLHEIRSALLMADPMHDTITRVAARFGVWDFSLFARNYKALFGEAPSETLRRHANESEVRGHMSWMRYVSRMFIQDPTSQATEPAHYAAAALGRADLLK